MTHPAERLFQRVPVVFTAHSAETAYLRERICAFALAREVVPVNPWMVGGYFLYGLVDKDLVRRANNNLLMRCDELWVFGSPSDGVDVEIAWAREHGLPVRRFALDHIPPRALATCAAHSPDRADRRDGSPVFPMY